MHKAACLLDSREPAEEQFQNLPRKRPVIPDIRNSLSKSDQAREAYLKLMRTAYEMALNPSMAHRHFEVLVKCQRINGVRLVQGRSGNKAGNNKTNMRIFSSFNFLLNKFSFVVIIILNLIHFIHDVDYIHLCMIFSSWHVNDHVY